MDNKQNKHIGLARREHKFLIINCNDDQFLSQLQIGHPLHIDGYSCIMLNIKNNEIKVQLSDDLLKKKSIRHFQDHTLVSLTSPNTMKSNPSISFEAQLSSFKNGNPLLIHTDTHSYLIILAQALTKNNLHMFRSYGVIQVPIEYSRASRLQLPLLQIDNEYYTTTCDLQGLGPSSDDQLETIHKLTTFTGKFTYPGHISPRIVSRQGPIKSIPEVSIALAKMVSKIPVTLMVSLTTSDGNLMTLPEALKMGEDQKIQSLFLDEIIEYLNSKIHRVTSIRTIPIQNMGMWEVIQYPTYQIMIKNNIYIGRPIVYIHMVCNCIDDILGIDEHGNLLQCACKRRYASALKLIHDSGAGLIIFPKTGPINYPEISSLLHDLSLSELEVINYEPDSLPEFDIHNLTL